MEISLQSHRYITFSDYVTHMQAIGGMRGIKGMLWETSLLDPDEARPPVFSTFKFYRNTCSLYLFLSSTILKKPHVEAQVSTNIFPLWLMEHIALPHRLSMDALLHRPFELYLY